MDDLISRQAAIDAINKAFERVFAWDGTGHLGDKVLENVPSADVVPVVHGKWIKVGVWGRVYRCNKCGNFLDFDGVNAGGGDANFCPNCGAKMEEYNG